MPNRILFTGMVGLLVASMVFGPVILRAVEDTNASVVLNAGEEEPVHEWSPEPFQVKAMAAEMKLGGLSIHEESEDPPSLCPGALPEVTREVCYPPPEA